MAFVSITLAKLANARIRRKRNFRITKTIAVHDNAAPIFRANLVPRSAIKPKTQSTTVPLGFRLSNGRLSRQMRRRRIRSSGFEGKAAKIAISFSELLRRRALGESHCQPRGASPDALPFVRGIKPRLSKDALWIGAAKAGR